MGTVLAFVERKNRRRKATPGEENPADWEDMVEEESEDSLFHDVGVFMREHGSAVGGCIDD